MRGNIEVRHHRIDISQADRAMEVCGFTGDECHRIILCDAGQAHVRVENQDYLLRPGYILLLCREERCAFEPPPADCGLYSLSVSSEYSMLNITEPALFSVLTERPSGFQNAFPLGEAAAEMVRKNMHRMMVENESTIPMKSFGMALLLNNILLDIYRDTGGLQMMNANSDSQRTVREIQSYISRNYMEAITLESVAARFYVSKFQISRIFKEVTGLGFKAYINLVRINEAKKLLAGTNETVTNICYEVGYNDVNNFIRSFQLAEGVTPLHFRKRESTWLSGQGGEAVKVYTPRKSMDMRESAVAVGR